MIDKKVIENRIKEVEKRRALLEEFAAMNVEDFASDFNTYELALRHLQVAIQACIDIGLHICSVLNLRNDLKESSRVFSLLAKEKIITKDLADRLNQAGAVRNILVHSYLEIDLKKIHQHLKTDLGDFDRFVSEIGKFLKRKT